MIKVGDVVMHRYNGLCKISGQKKLSFKGPLTNYYVLVPVYDGASTIYVPKDKAKELLRRPLSKEEIIKLISEMPHLKSVWIDDMKRRKDAYTQIVLKGDPYELVAMIHSIREKAIEKNAIGKRISEADQRSLQIAEKVVHGEIAYALDMSPAEVPGLIRKQYE